MADTSLATILPSLGDPSAALRHIEKWEAEHRLIDFFRLAWPQIDPAILSINWHHECVSEHLEALARGEIQKLLINVPPRTSKSILVNVCFPAWLWAQPDIDFLSGPQVRFLCVSYGETPASRQASLARQLLMGQWYQSLWGERVKITKDGLGEIQNSAGGYRISTSLSGAILGSGGDLIICFPADEVVWTETGPQQIGRVVESRAPIRVWSKNPTTGMAELRPIIGWHKNPGCDIVEVRLIDGRRLRCTPNHLLWTDEGWREAAQVRIGQSVLSAQMGPIATLLDEHHGSSRYAITRGKLSRAVAAAKNFASLVFSEFCSRAFLSAVPSVGLLDMAQMTPGHTRPDRHYSARAHIKLLRQGLVGFSAFQNLDSLDLGQFGLRFSFAEGQRSMPSRIVDVLQTGSIKQIAKSWISRISISVSGLFSFRAWAKKCQRHQSVGIAVSWVSVPGKGNSGISVDDGSFQDATALAVSWSARSVSPPSVEAPYSAEGRNFVEILKSDNGFPLFDFIPVVAIREVGHIDHTFCISVEDNHNMVMGEATILSSNCDDPHSTENAESEIERDRTVRLFAEGLTTRRTVPTKTATVVIMQRLHENDISGYILEKEYDYTHICLPMRFDPRRYIPSRWYSDPRTEQDELLWPQQFPLWKVEEDERELGSYAAAGQYQQSPVPRGGGIIQRLWWRLWPDDSPEMAEQSMVGWCDVCRWTGPAYDAEFPCPQCGANAGRKVLWPQFSFRMLSIDTSYGDKEENSWSAITGWGIWHGRDEAPRAMLTNAWRGRPKLRTDPLSKEMGLVERTHKIATEMNVDTILIEKKTRGVDLYQELEKQVQEWPYRLEYWDPTGRGDKVARLHATTPLFTNDLIWAPNTKWAETVISEVCSQPRAKFSDLTDTCTATLLHLRHSGLLTLPDEHRREQLRARGQGAVGIDRRRNSVAELYEGA